MNQVRESFLLILLLLSGQSRAMDGCKETSAWRCGDQCIYRNTKCKCGDSTFGSGESQWCCIVEEGGCEGKGESSERLEFWRGEKNNEGIKIGADCSEGQAQNLTEPCRGVCNSFPEDANRNRFAERSFLPCKVSDRALKTTQCIREAD